MQQDYETLENERLYKFTKNYAYDYQENQIGGFLNKVINRNSAENTINFIEDERAFNINYLSSQIAIANQSSPPIARPVWTGGALGRTVADYLFGSKKRGITAGTGNLNPQMQYQVFEYNRYNANLEIYSNALSEWAKIVSGYVNNLTNQKSLLESHSFI
jgi:hypothetical protein